MQCTNPIFVHRKGFFPCGKCLSCRIAKSREWSLRLMNELGYWNKSVFLTLTYDDEHLPKDNSLHKEELQKFLKRLRKRYKQKIKYFGCGEYGEKVRTLYDVNGQGEALGRPHFHLIVYGLGNDKFSKECVKDSWRYCNWSMLQDTKTFGSVTYDSCRYVSDYIFKKYNSVKGLEVYGQRNPPFKVGSLGLGERFAKDNAEQLINNRFTTFKGVKVALPRYYCNKLGIEYSWSDRWNAGQKEMQKWKNYVKKYHHTMADVADIIYSSRMQRALNAETRAKIFHKGEV